jgi:hypothetical protein
MEQTFTYFGEEGWFKTVYSSSWDFDLWYWAYVIPGHSMITSTRNDTMNGRTIESPVTCITASPTQQITAETKIFSQKVFDFSFSKKDRGSPSEVVQGNITAAIPSLNWSMMLEVDVSIPEK